MTEQSLVKIWHIYVTFLKSRESTSCKSRGWKDHGSQSMGRSVVGHGLLDVAQPLHDECMVAVAALLELREVGGKERKESTRG